MRWLVCSVAVLLGGCSTTQIFHDTRVPSEPAFRDMWARYAACRSGTGVIETWQNAEQLNRAVRLMNDSARTTHVFPQMFVQAPAAPSPRLAVDPKAMAAACTLSAGHVAHEAGLDRLAEKLFRSVLVNFDDSRYAYYREQAWKGMVQLGTFSGERNGSLSRGLRSRTIK